MPRQRSRSTSRDGVSRRLIVPLGPSAFIGVHRRFNHSSALRPANRVHDKSVFLCQATIRVLGAAIRGAIGQTF